MIRKVSIYLGTGLIARLWSSPKHSDKWNAWSLSDGQTAILAVGHVISSKDGCSNASSYKNYYEAWCKVQFEIQ